MRSEIKNSSSSASSISDFGGANDNQRVMGVETHEEVCLQAWYHLPLNSLVLERLLPTHSDTTPTKSSIEVGSCLRDIILEVFEFESAGST